MELSFETILGFVMVLIGVFAWGFIIKANKKFPEGSELQKTTKNLLPVIFFLMCFSLWHVLREAFHWKKLYGEFMEYPEYIFISIAYILLFKASKALFDTAKKIGIIND